MGLDEMFDKIEKGLGELEKASKGPAGVWRVEEIIDHDSGEKFFELTDGKTPRKLHAWDAEFAEYVVNLLNAKEL